MSLFIAESFEYFCSVFSSLEEALVNEVDAEGLKSDRYAKDSQAVTDFIGLLDAMFVFFC